MGWAVEPNSLKRIYDYSRRKGNRIEPLFFPDEMNDYVQVRDSYRSLFNDVLAGFKKSTVVQKHDFEQKSNNYIPYDKIGVFFPGDEIDCSFDKKKIKLLMHLLVKSKKEKIYNKLSTVASSITKDGIKWELDSKIRIRKGKEVYSLDSKDIESFFVSKVIQQSIKERYRIVMSNRSVIVKQVSELISMNSPFSIIRTDIQSFFESIPHDKLIKLVEESKLPQSQIVAVCNLLEKCRSQFGNNGLPRGIGLSSYLSELYLSDFDRLVKNLDAVIYYNRYVDDIIVVVLEDNYSKQENAQIVKEEMIKLISAKGLSFHSGDGKDIIISNPSSTEPPCDFNYLGYKFTLTNEKVRMDIAESKVQKYCARINYAAWSYWNSPSMTIKKRNQLFVDRIRFLAMKTRLNSDKQNVLSGLPCRYPLIDEKSVSLIVLDSYLSNICGKMPIQIRNSVGRNKKISFSRGFISDKVLKFRDSYIGEITKIWKSL